MDGCLRDGWKIPAAAWHRPIGDYPPGATGTHPPMMEPGPAQCRTKRGIPLGGIGTGSFMFNLAGSFGPWEFSHGDDSPGAKWGVETGSGHEERFVKGAGFHIYMKHSGLGKPFLRTLATEDVLPAWPAIEKGSGTYHALFPKGWFTYDSMPMPVTLKFFSPFVARDYKLSSLPVAMFQFKIENKSNEAADVAIMFTFPNAVFREKTGGHEYPRKGLRCVHVTSQYCTGVRMQAEEATNVPTTQQTEWAIAARNDCGPGASLVSVTWAGWSESDGGKHIIDSFSQSGELPGKVLDKSRAGDAGAISVKATIRPGNAAILTFSLAWDFPVVQFTNPASGTRWLKRYKEWYPGHYRGWDIAREALEHIDAIEQDVDRWWRMIVDEPRYPDWLKRAALNELYYDVFGGTFWESKCVSKAKKYGNRPGQHLYFTLEANVYRDAETFDVRHYECHHLRVLFPSIERDVLLAWADFIMDDPEGRVPHDAGSPVGDPYFIPGQYSSTSPGQRPPALAWKDLPSMFVQQVHAFWKHSHDGTFLREAFPAADKAMNFLSLQDKDGDGLPEHDGIDTTYDSLHLEGTSTFIAGLYAGALAAMVDMCAQVNEHAKRAMYQSRLDAAKLAIETKLWSPLGHYRSCSKGPYADGIMSDALNGQRYASVAGLASVFDPYRMSQHLNKVFRFNFLGRDGGKFGAVNLVGPNGEDMPGDLALGTWPGGTYFTAATMYRTGKDLGDMELMDKGLAIAKSIHDITYESESAAFWFDTPAFFYPEDPPEFRAQQNMRPRAVWELLLEVFNPF